MNESTDEDGEDATWHFGARYPEYKTIEAFLSSGNVADDLESSQDDDAAIQDLS